MKYMKDNPYCQMMLVPLVTNPNRLFTLKGLVSHKRIEVNYTHLRVITLDILAKPQVEELFDVYCFKRTKQFADKYVLEGNVIDVTGDMKISQNPNRKGQIILVAKHLQTYRIDLEGYGTEKIPDYINPSELKDEDLAY